MAHECAAEAPSCHILEFFYDESDGCALTAFINGVRFHIMVDPDELTKYGDQTVLNSYLRHLQALKHREDAAALEGAGDSADPEGVEDTHGWQHDTTPTGHESKEDSDSGVDLKADEEEASKHAARTKISNPEKDLQNWILSSFGEETRCLAPMRIEQKKKSLKDWYYTDTYFFEVTVEGGKLIPKRLEESDELHSKTDALIPRLAMPKYIRHMELPWVDAADIEVLTEIDEPGPLHPAEVRVNGEVRFFKPVDPSQPDATKREIKILREIESRGLREEIRVPQLYGLVAVPGSQTQIMGSLQSNIPSPRPLTTLLDSDVAEEKRLRWADESKGVIQSLHKHKIIWGDAKADNFLVDKDDNLWIIDFGGSYTEGWVAPELCETKEGDQMGLDKVVEALVDPDENTFDPEDEDEQDGDYVPQQGKKRQRDPVGGQNGREAAQSGSATQQDSTYCFCDGPSSGEMVGCDGDDCARKWFHMECLGLDSPPESEKWYCPGCESQMIRPDDDTDDDTHHAKRRRKATS